MFDIGWTELMVIGIVALIVVGPKDLPKMFRTLGQMTAKARGMAREFQRAMDDAADSTGVKDMARDLRKATDPQGMGLDEFNKMRKWDPLKDDDASTKPDGSDAKGPDADDDEAAFDKIASEMDNLRKERAPRDTAQTPAGKPAAKSAAATPPAPDTAQTPPAPTPPEGDQPDTKDKGQA